VPRHLVVTFLVALAATACSAAVAVEDTAPSSSLTTLASLTTTTSSTTTIAPPTSTTTTLPPEPVKETIVISGAGDVNLDPAFVRSLPGLEPEQVWEGLRGAFLDDDLTVVNLECSPSPNGSPWNKPWTFRCDPAFYPAMAAAGVEVANLANNHGMDYGFEAMLEGRGFLLESGVVPVGTGANREEAYTPYIVEIGAWTVAIIGSGGVHPETGSWIATDDQPGMSDGDDTESIAEAIRAAKEVADIVIVTAHWGEQGTFTPRAFEQRQAEAWIDAGADGVFGHHQHVLQPLGFYKGKPIAWGLGNFVWQGGAAMSWRRTAIAQFTFNPDGTVGACLVDVLIGPDGGPDIVDPEARFCEPAYDETA